MGYEGQSAFRDGRIHFVNGVFSDCRRGVVGSRRGVLGSSGGMCRDSRDSRDSSSRGHQPFHCTPQHHIPTSAGHFPRRCNLNGNEFNSGVRNVCRVGENQHAGLGPGHPGRRKDSRVRELMGDPSHTECWQNSRRCRDQAAQICVGRNNRSYFGRRGKNGSNRANILGENENYSFRFCNFGNRSRDHTSRVCGPRDYESQFRGEGSKSGVPDRDRENSLCVIFFRNFGANTFEGLAAQDPKMQMKHFCILYRRE